MTGPTIPEDGVIFLIDGVGTEVIIPAATFARLDGSWESYVGALNAQIAATPKLAGYSFSLDYGNSKAYTMENGVVSYTIPAIVLTSFVGTDVTSLDFHWGNIENRSHSRFSMVQDGPSPGGAKTLGFSFSNTYYSETFQGSNGIDTVIYADSRAASHTMTKIAEDWWEVSSSDGNTDFLFDIERIQFSNISVAFDTDGNAGQVYRIYQAAFNRTPDKAGLGYWLYGMDHGLSLLDVSRGFINSPEFALLYGANPTSAEIVTRLYQNVLHRAPEKGGFDYWINQLDGGYQTRTQVLTGFSESPENQAQIIGVIQNGIEYIQHHV